MKQEAELIRECLEHEGIDEQSANAFGPWLDSLERGAFRSLSELRREWLLRVCRRLGIETGSENLVSTGVVKPSAAERASLKAFHESLGPRPLKPPGRRA